MKKLCKILHWDSNHFDQRIGKIISFDCLDKSQFEKIDIWANTNNINCIYYLKRFNYNDNYGCYDSLLMKKDQILKNQNLKKLQRGNLIDNYLQLYISSTNCYKHFDNKKIKLFIEKELNP